MNTFETHVVSPRGNSRIVVGNGALARLGELAATAVKGRRVCVVTDANVGNLHLEPALASLRAAGFAAESVALPAGEKTKSVEWLVTLWNTFNGYGLTRSDLVVALGGGVVGDLAGFASATYLRGCAIVQVPTSLLAQVDSSVGGKTGIDLPFGKNLAGAFHQPAVVVVDPLVLKTLPPTRFAEGMAEVVKYGCIANAGLFADLEAFAGNPGDAEALRAIIQRCVQIKADVVNRDELDTGERMLLNFGHTLAHTIEQHYHYTRESHGEAVAIGMYQITKIAEEMRLTKTGEAEHIRKVLDIYGLPHKCDLMLHDLIGAIALDKKNLGGKLNVVLLKEIGKSYTYPTTTEFFTEHDRMV